MTEHNQFESILKSYLVDHILPGLGGTATAEEISLDMVKKAKANVRTEDINKILALASKQVDCIGGKDSKKKWRLRSST